MNNEVQRWADSAMFHAEPLKAADGPKVYLLEMSSDPLGQIAAACKMYKGEVVRSLSDVTDEERMGYFQQVQNTKLKAPFEFVKFHFLLEGVSRSLTHQLVRQRTAAYAQESLRFAVKENLQEGVALPPSLSGTQGGEPLGAESSTQEYQRNVWDQAVEHIEQAYLHLIDTGMPAEEARDLLPHGITTRVHYTTDLRALQDHAGNRLCTQAQFQWRLLWTRIVEAIRTYDPRRANAERLYGEDGQEWTPEMLPDRWQFEALAGIFRPVCYLTGKCEFKANFDRSCKIRDRVDANERIGRPSSEWDKPFWGDEGYPGFESREPDIKPILPAEWLLDPGAAR